MKSPELDGVVALSEGDDPTLLVFVPQDANVKTRLGSRTESIVIRDMGVGSIQAR